MPSPSIWSCSAPSTPEGGSGWRSTPGWSLRASTWKSAPSTALSPRPSLANSRTNCESRPSETSPPTTSRRGVPSAARRLLVKA
ncbi:hypothetical protein [Variovorax paradoxus]|uniref:hypothetical protein n=1 Tax=Variovorax paradoxus TaxID=34073 RepID=UPI001E31B8BA|nr:hypothetical protein [Variovorax paradoxus]